MNRQELAAYLTNTYSTNGEQLFARYPNFEVFRHTGNKKWFAVLMDIPRKNLGPTGEGQAQVVNLKCDTRLILRPFREGLFREFVSFVSNPDGNPIYENTVQYAILKKEWEGNVK